MDIDDVGLGVEVVVPDVLQQHRAGDHLAGVPHQVLEDTELPRLEVDRLTRPGDLVGDQIHLEIGDPQNGLFRRRLSAAQQQSFEQAVELDPAWEPAQLALQRVRGTITQMEFDQRMTEGLTARAEGDYLGARAAFRMAEKLKPGSPEPADVPSPEALLLVTYG